MEDNKEIISKLDLNKARRLDCYSCNCLKDRAAGQAPFLSKLYNDFFPIFCFPSCWKFSSVVPTFKNTSEPFDTVTY